MSTDPQITPEEIDIISSVMDILRNPPPQEPPSHQPIQPTQRTFPQTRKVKARKTVQSVEPKKD